MLAWQKPYEKLFSKLGYQIGNETAFRNALAAPADELEASDDVEVGQTTLDAAITSLVVQHVKKTIPQQRKQLIKQLTSDQMLSEIAKTLELGNYLDARKASPREQAVTVKALLGIIRQEPKTVATLDEIIGNLWGSQVEKACLETLVVRKDSKDDVGSSGVLDSTPAKQAPSSSFFKGEAKNVLSTSVSPEQVEESIIKALSEHLNGIKDKHEQEKTANIILQELEGVIAVHQGEDTAVEFRTAYNSIKSYASKEFIEDFEFDINPKFIYPSSATLLPNILKDTCSYLFKPITDNAHILKS